MQKHILRFLPLLVMIIFIQPYTPATAQAIAGCPILPEDNVWNTPVDDLPVHPLSEAYINTIGAERSLRADFGSGIWPPEDGGPIGIPYIVVAGSQPKVNVTFDYDDESDPGPYPIPPNAPIEGGPNADGDRHVLVLDEDNCLLYEVYSAYPQSDGSWAAGSGAIYDLNSNALRPDGWTSADAAGLPILPGLVRYDEVAAGEITHALRFTVPSTQRAYVWPARHFASSITDPAYPPMGLRFRLKADFDISGYSPEAQVILRALKTYGMILADNGSSWYISGAPDERWNNDNLRDLLQVVGGDLEAVDTSSLIIDPDSGQARQQVDPSVGAPTQLRLEGALNRAPVRPTFFWNHATGQRFNIVLESSTADVYVNQWVAAEEVCSSGTCAFTLDPAAYLIGLTNGGYTWKVRAEINGARGAWSTTEAFTVALPAPQPPTPFAVEASTGRPVITLPDDPGTSWVNVYIGTPDFSTVHLQWYELATSAECNGTTCILLPNAHPVNGSYVVYIQTWGPLGLSTGGIQGWHGPQNFTLSLPPAALIEPLTATINAGKPTMTWNAAEGATWYQIWVGTDAPEYATQFTQWLPAVDLGCAGTGMCVLTVESVSLGANATYVWYVQSWGPGGIRTSEGLLGWQAGTPFITP